MHKALNDRRHQGGQDDGNRAVRPGDGERQRAAQRHDRSADRGRQKGHRDAVGEHMIERAGKNQRRVGQAVGDRQNAADRSGKYIRRARRGTFDYPRGRLLQQYQRPSFDLPPPRAGLATDLQHVRRRGQILRVLYVPAESLPLPRRPPLHCDCGQCRARVGTDALHHRAEAVRTLRRKVFTQTHPLEQGDRVCRKNIFGVLA